MAANKRQRLRALNSANVDIMSGDQCENYIAHLLRAQGYRRVSLTKRSGDFGVDLPAVKDGLRWAIHAKRHRSSVGNKAINEADGDRNHYACDRTMVVTNSFFTAHAKIAAFDNNTVLIDRDTLAKWIIDYQAGRR